MPKTLILVNNIDELEIYKKVGMTNFLFAVKNFSIGYISFELKDIPYDSYLFINRLFDNDLIELLKEQKNEFIKYRGIIFEDLGVYQVFKDTKIELILNQTHFLSNKESVNFWLERVNSIVLPNELTKEEIEYIVTHANKPIVITRLAKNMIMYSRRNLLSNYNTYQHLPNKKSGKLVENISGNEFDIKEDENGTVLFNNEYFNYQELNLDDNKILYNLYLNLDLKPKEIIEIIKGKKIGNDGFLNRKTVYRLKDFKGEK